MLDNIIVNVINLSYFHENCLNIYLYILIQLKYRLAELYLQADTTTPEQFEYTKVAMRKRKTKR